MKTPFHVLADEILHQITTMRIEERHLVETAGI